MMAPSDPRLPSCDSSPRHESSAVAKQSTDALLAVPYDITEQATQPSLEGDAQTSKGSIKVKWTFSEELEGGSVSTPILDIVIVQGLHGSGKGLAEEGANSWTHQYLKSFCPGSRLMLFEWESHHIFAGVETCSLIGALSQRLLHDLVNVGGEKSMRRSIMFVADDLGSLVLKNALVTAVGSRDRSWLDIVDRTRTLIFRGCPHRSVDQREMEDKMAEFVFGAGTNTVPHVARPTLAAMPGLAGAAIQINGLFILAKINIKCSLISVHHGGRYVAGGSSGVFDEFVGTFGLPFERRIDSTTVADGKQSSTILHHLQALSAAGPEDEGIEWLERRYERTLMRLSSLVATFKTPPFEQWPLLQDSEVFAEWRDATTSDFLYVHGDIDMTETSEQIFYILDQQAIRGRIHEPVLYFSFDGHDTTRNTLSAMLATFLSQMICHNADLCSSTGEATFVQLNEEHAWTDRDLLQWFSQYSSDFFKNSAFLVIDSFDECPEAGRDSFLECLYHRMASEETILKVAVTSRRSISLPRGLRGWRHIYLADAITSHERLDKGTQSINSKELMKSMSRHRPELLIDDRWVQSANRISSSDPLVQSIILAHSISISEWSRKLSMEEIFNLVGNENSNDELLMKILDSVLRKLADRFQIRTMLIWLLYSARPLTLWEFTSVMYPECLDNPCTSPGRERVRDFVQICEEHLRGVVEIRDTTIRLRDPRLATLLKKTPSASPVYLWSDIVPSRAAYDITKFCLQFLARHNVQQQLESMVEQAGLDEHMYEPVSGYTNFCSYATFYWPWHAALFSTEIELLSLLEEHRQTSMNSSWLKAYWCLENPVTRSKQASDSVDILLANFGLPHSDIGMWDQRSIGLATQRAAAQGQSEIVKRLLHRCERSDSTLMDALIAAASSGQEQLVLQIFENIKKAKNGDSKTFKWPPCLLYRAAWLGMGKFARALLEAGCPPEPGGSMAEKPRLSPLHQATRHGHIATMRVLLSHGADTSFATALSRNLLFTAADSGRPEVFKTLFDKAKANVSDVDKYKDTPLSYAANWGMTAAVKSLLEIGADPHNDKNLKSSDIGWLPLIISASEGRTESVRILLDGGADPNQPGHEGFNTALWYAAMNDFPQTVCALLEKGADPNHPLLQHPILRELVAEAGITAAAKLDLINLMVEFGASVDAADVQGKTALMYAVEAGLESVVARLLELGASVSAEDENQVRPLHLAAGKGSETILNLILTKSPDLDCLDAWHRTALSYAVKFADIARILLENGAGPDLPGCTGYTPLAISAHFGHPKTVKVLLEHGAQVNLQTNAADGARGGWTAVCLAASTGRPDIVQMLVDAGALLSLKTNLGSIPLHVATLSTARVLLQHRKRFNIDEPNKYNMTPLHCAIKNSQDTDLIKVLINSGADLNLQNDSGGTPLAIAVFKENREFVKLLLQEEDCNKDLVSKNGRSALGFATAVHKDLEIVKLLVESGADVNLVGKLVGSILQAACENRKRGKDMIDYLLDNGANLHAQGGTIGFAISAAALYGTPEIISHLLQHGATVNVADAMGRTPIQMSCSGGALNFQEIYKAGGNHSLWEKDKFERTVFHWAAQHGAPQVLENLIAEIGTELINEPDLDGWTPLLWACWPGKLEEADLGSAKNDNGPEQHRTRVFRILLENGAKPDITGKIGDSVWSLHEVARFNRIETSCLQQLGDALKPITIRPVVASEDVEPMKGRIGALMRKTCAACYYSIRGIDYVCSKCDMHLCNKCSWHRDLIHKPVCDGAEWEKRGPEFEEENVPVELAGVEEGDEHGDEHENSNSSPSSDTDSSTEE